MSAASYLNSYRIAIRASVRGLWVGAGDRDWFMIAMRSAIQVYLRHAAEEGAATCGIAPDEMTFRERMAIQAGILEQQMYVDSFADFIEQNSKVMGGKLGTVFNRVPAWVQRYNEVRERMKSMACSDYKATWHFGPTKEHCTDCAYAVGRTYRLSVWDRYGYVPGSSELNCGGWRCACTRDMTDARVTPGRPRTLQGP